jgi:hypothetical protein
MKIVPYLVLEIVLPGGTLFALALWLYRNRKRIFSNLSNRHPAIRLVAMTQMLFCITRRI